MELAEPQQGFHTNTILCECWNEQPTLHLCHYSLRLQHGLWKILCWLLQGPLMLPATSKNYLISLTRIYNAIFFKPGGILYVFVYRLLPNYILQSIDCISASDTNKEDRFSYQNNVYILFTPIDIIPFTLYFKRCWLLAILTVFRNSFQPFGMIKLAFKATFRNYACSAPR